MSRGLFAIEKGLHAIDENGSTGVAYLHGAAAPGGDAAEQDAAEQGSLYLRTNGTIYQKELSGTGADKWTQLLSPSVSKWREEKVFAASNDVLSAGATDPSNWTDNDGSIDDTDFSIGDFVIGDADGTPVLWKVTALPGSPNITLSAVASNEALAAGDIMVVDHYLPDSGAAQEARALVVYTGAAPLVKIADFNWEIATGIFLSGGYAASSGDVSSGDSVEVATQKLDGNVDNVNSQIGRAQSDTHMGTYTGTIITDNESAKENIQELEVDLDALQTMSGRAAESTHMGTYTGDLLNDNETIKQNIQQLETEIESCGGKRASSNAITAPVTLDEVLVDEYMACEWLLTLWLDSDPARRQTMKVIGHHDGVIAPGTPADAGNVDDTLFAKIKLGATFNHVIVVDLNGAGGTQTMRLRISASAAISARAIRTDNVF